MSKELLFSITSKDFEWSYTRGTGPGGQKRNKTSSCVHCFHPPSGAKSISDISRSQHINKQDAFLKCVNSKKFKIWHKIEISKRMKNYIDIDDVVNEQMKNSNIILEIKDNGKWIKVEDLEEEKEENEQEIKINR